MDLLLVERDHATARLYASSLERASWRVRWESTVARGIAAALERTYDALLLDCAPARTGDGLEVLRAVRDRGLSTPAIIQSSRGNEDLARSAGALGVAAVLAKPVDLSSLILCLAAASTAPIVQRDALEIAREQLAELGRTIDGVDRVWLAVLLRTVGDRTLPLVGVPRLCLEISTLARGQVRDWCGVMEALDEARATITSVTGLEQVLSVLSATEIGSAAALAYACAQSERTLRKGLISINGQGISWWRRISRVRRLVSALVTTNEQAGQCAYQAGYLHARHSWRDCREFLALSPNEVRRAAQATRHASPLQRPRMGCKLHDLGRQ